VGEFAKESDVQKKATDNAMNYNALQWCHDWAGTIATKGVMPAQQRQRCHHNKVKGASAMLAAMHM
jgi:hypothetical protein